MAASELRDAWRKLDRAKKHVADTEAALERSQPGMIYAEETDVDFEAVTESRYLVPIWNDNLTEANCAAGDAVHNLRSALDSLACALPKKMRLTDKELRNVSFPIFPCKAAFDKRKSEITARFGADVYAAVSELRPYRDGDIFLWAISHFDNVDKHRQLLRFGHVVTVTRHTPGLGNSAINVAAINAGPNIQRESWRPFEQHIKVATKPLDEGWAAPTRSDARRVNVTFGDVEELAEYPIIMLLNRFRDLTEQILEEFDRTFFP